MRSSCMGEECHAIVEAPDELAGAAVELLCDRCGQERVLARVERQRSRIGVPTALARYTLADVDQPEGLEDAMELVSRWVRGDVALVGLEGPIGVGKTCMASAAANMLAARGQRVRYYSTASLARTLSLKWRDPRREEAVEALMGHCALVLDDIEIIGTSQHAANQLYVDINERIVGAAPLLVTTNLSLAELEVYWAELLGGQRIASRLCLLDWEYLDGADKRAAAHG